jgi:hypothetical protein
MDMQVYLPDDQVQQIQNIIAVIQDPKKYQKAITELTSKHDSLLDAMKTSQQTAADIAKAQQDLDGKVADLKSQELRQKASQTWLEQEKDRLAKLASDLSNKSDTLDQKVKDLASKSAELDYRESSVKQSEYSVQQKHIAADSVLEDAKKQKMALDAKVAKLKELAGA